MHQAAELDEHGKHLKLQMVQMAFDDLTNVRDVMFPVERYKFINEIHFYQASSTELCFV